LSDDVRKLVNRCLAGEQAAFEELVDTYAGQVFALCFRMLRHRQDAEDVTQDSFVRALRSLRRWDPEREFLPWLLAIAGNRCRTLLSARTRRPAARPLVDGMNESAATLDPTHNLTEEIERALGTLRLEYRQAFLMFHEHQLSYAQISEALGCPLGTVKTWVHRARHELILELKQRGVIEDSSRCDAKSLKIV
jgi:RNA polymerase sigma-70 factor (ECF subfamily)